MVGSVASLIITVQMKCEMKALQQHIKKRSAMAETANQHRTCYSVINSRDSKQNERDSCQVGGERFGEVQQGNARHLPQVYN